MKSGLASCATREFGRGRLSRVALQTYPSLRVGGGQGELQMWRSILGSCSSLENQSEKPRGDGSRLRVD